MIERRKEVERIVLEHIRSNSISYKYLLTCEYFYKQKDYNKVLLDNKHLRKTIRRFYKDNIKMMFFVEKHTDPDSNHYGGYHRHILIEDASSSRWLEPSTAMTNFMLKLDEAAAFGMKMRLAEPTPELKGKLLCKVARDLNHAVSNGYLGTDVRPVSEERGGISGLVEYLTKQLDIFHPAYELIDVSNSDIDPKPLLKLYDAANKVNRYKNVFTRTH